MPLDLAAEIADRMLGSIMLFSTHQGSIDAVEADAENFADMIVSALAARNQDVACNIHASVERVYSHLRVSEPFEGGSLLTGELRALTMIASVAAKREWLPPPQEIALKPTSRKILQKLLGSRFPMGNQELARASGCSEEAVARNLPELRSAGLVQSTKIWKRQVNELTAAGRLIAEEGKRRANQTAPQQITSTDISPEAENLINRAAENLVSVVMNSVPSDYLVEHQDLHVDVHKDLSKKGLEVAVAVT